MHKLENGFKKKFCFISVDLIWLKKAFENENVLYEYKYVNQCNIDYRESKTNNYFKNNFCLGRVKSCDDL